MKGLVLACLAFTLMSGALSVTTTTVSLMGPQGLTVNVTNPGFNVITYRTVSSVAATTLPPATSPTTPAPGSTVTSPTTQSTTTTAPPITTTAMPGRTGSVNLTVSGLRELDSTGAAVTANGHTVASALFPSQVFTATSNATYTTALSPTITASCQQFVASPVTGLNSTATTINVTICTTSTAGTISASTEVEPVLVGQTIIYLNVNQWQWSATGTYLEVNVTLQVANGRTWTRARASSANTTMRCGTTGNSNDAYADISGMATSDSSIVAQSVQPSLNPSAAGVSTVTVTVRLPKFTTSSGFYMLVEPGWMPVKGGSGVVGAATRVQAVNSWAMVIGMIMGTAAMMWY